MLFNDSACAPQVVGVTADHTHDPDPPAKGEGAWTKDRVELLIRFYGEEYTRSEIADEINKQTGSSFNRNSISGKIDRLSLTENPTKTAEEKAAAHARKLEREAERKREARLKVNAPPA